jgi:3-carboxy-cis,cis-muconate cycloisomerase
MPRREQLWLRMGLRPGFASTSTSRGKTKRCSLSAEDGLFAPIVSGDELLAATGDRAWLQALLEVEAALARAEAEVGIIPSSAADAIATCCTADRFDPGELGRAARLGGNPVIPLVKSLTAAVPVGVQNWVHWGATSQDILDSAAMLVTRRALELIERDLTGLADGCAALADRHRDTLMAGRTLLQQALPITFGLKAAGWLVATIEVRSRVIDVRSRLPAQLGGAAGTLAALGQEGPAVAARLATRLGLAEPLIPWHTSRQPVAEVAAALGLVAGTAAKVAIDVALLMQTEVGEAFEPAAPGRGASSTLPHKRNPIGAAGVIAASRRAHGLIPVIFGGMVQEHERAVGGWQAEWQTLTDLLRLAGGAASRVRETIEGLEVDADAMRDNLALTGGLLMAEQVTLALSRSIHRADATRAVQRAGDRAAAADRSFAAELLDDPVVAAVLSADELEELLDPAGYLGATDTFIDRALEAYHSLAHHARLARVTRQRRGG